MNIYIATLNPRPKQKQKAINSNWTVQSVNILYYPSRQKKMCVWRRLLAKWGIGGRHEAVLSEKPPFLWHDWVHTEPRKRGKKKQSPNTNAACIRVYCCSSVSFVLNFVGRVHWPAFSVLLRVLLSFLLSIGPDQYVMMFAIQSSKHNTSIKRLLFGSSGKGSFYWNVLPQPFICPKYRLL